MIRFNNWFLEMLYVVSVFYGSGNPNAIVGLDSSWSKIKVYSWGE